MPTTHTLTEADVTAIVEEKNRLVRENAALRQQVQGHAERIAAQSELLSRRACKPLAEVAAADLAALALSKPHSIRPGDRVRVEMPVVHLPGGDLVICETADGRRVAFDRRECERVE